VNRKIFGSIFAVILFSQMQSTNCYISPWMCTCSSWQTWKKAEKKVVKHLQLVTATLRYILSYQVQQLHGKTCLLALLCHIHNKWCDIGCLKESDVPDYGPQFAVFVCCFHPTSVINSNHENNIKYCFVI